MNRFQRIGRIGRHSKGTIYIIHSGSFLDEVIFREPESLLHRPLGESALYVKNPRIQYIHALCLARSGGEHDQVNSIPMKDEEYISFQSTITWPEGFLGLCKSERTGEIPADLQAMKAEAGDDPNHTYPLRDVESQFRVQLKQGPIHDEKGSLSHSQLLREAYPGAVYYYATQALRVYSVRIQSRLVYVRHEKRYSTSPKMIPTQIFPNLTSDNVYDARLNEKLVVFESNIQVRESVTGFEERRGSRKPELYKYPIDKKKLNIYFDQARFTRNYFTSGVILAHPCFNNVSASVNNTVAKLIYEAFLMSIPFERQDIDFAVGRYFINRPPFVEEGNKFLAIYDKTYGSLRLSGNVMKENLMLKVFEQALVIANLTEYQDNTAEEFKVTSDVLDILKELLASVQKPSQPINLVTLEAQKETETESTEKIIMPGSTGLALRNNNQEYFILKIFYNPKSEQLCYQGRYKAQSETDTSVIIFPVSDVVEIPGESKMGSYTYETGEIN